MGTITRSFANLIGANGPTALPSGVGGKVLQVVSTIKTNSFSSSSTSYVDITGLSLSITPSSASNKILVFANIFSNSINGTIINFQLVRNSTAIAIGTDSRTYIGTVSNFISSTTDENSTLTNSFNFYDSPSTTSSTTYKVQVKNNTANAATFINNRPANDYSFVSTITAMEIAG